MNEQKLGKSVIVMVLEVLKRYSDENHRLKQNEIAAHIWRDYSERIQAKTVKRNLEKLYDMGVQIEYTEIPRKVKGEDSEIWTDIYLGRDITDAELRLLIDGLLFSKYIPYSECKALIKKLEDLSSEYFEAKVGHIKKMPTNRPENKELFLTIEVIDEAIAKDKKVAFHFLEYGMDKKPRIKKEGGKPKEYVVSPYQMVAANSRYYLVCSHEDKDKFYHYRLDYIRDAIMVVHGKTGTDGQALDDASKAQIQRLDAIREGGKIANDKRRPITEIVGANRELNLPKYMDEHIYMYSGKSVSAEFRTDRDMVGTVLDWFGNAAIIKEDGDGIKVTVDVIEDAMLYWALQFGKRVEVLTPKKLRDKIREAVQGMWEKYRSTDEKIPTQNE